MCILTLRLNYIQSKTRHNVHKDSKQKLWKIDTEKRGSSEEKPLAALSQLHNFVYLESVLTDDQTVIVVDIG